MYVCVNGTLLLYYRSSFILLVYLVVGTIRGTIKGRAGCDRLPNSDFWLELPFLVRVSSLKFILSQATGGNS